MQQIPEELFALIGEKSTDRASFAEFIEACVPTEDHIDLVLSTNNKATRNGKSWLDQVSAQVDNNTYLHEVRHIQDIAFSINLILVSVLADNAKVARAMKTGLDKCKVQLYGISKSDPNKYIPIPLKDVIDFINKEYTTDIDQMLDYINKKYRK